MKHSHGGLCPRALFLDPGVFGRCTLRGHHVAKKKARKKAARRRKAVSSGGRGGATLRSASAGDLQAELQRRAGQVADLEARRAELMAQVDEIDSEIGAINAALGAPAGRGGARRAARPARGSKAPGRRRAAAKRGGRKRPRNDSSLEVSLANVLKGKTMGVSEVADAVQAAGYKTTSPNFRTIVNQTLIRSDLIKKIGRGKYTAK